VYLRAASRLVRENFSQWVSLDRDNDGNPTGVNAQGLDMAMEEIASMLRANDMPLYHEGPVEINQLQNSDSTSPALTVSAYQNDGAGAVAADFTGIVVVDGGIQLAAGDQITIGGAQITLENLDLTGIANYDSGSVQLLGHDSSGDLYWYDTGSC